MSTSPSLDPPHPATASCRGTAQDRLLDGVTQAADRYGFAGLTVERILASTGVSRSTFYSYYSNVKDCFRVAYRRHSEQLGRDVEAAAVSRPDREVAALEALAAFAISRPAAARLLMREGLAAGPAGVIERDQLITRVVQAGAGSASARAAVDLPAEMLVGGAFRFLLMRSSDGTLARPVVAELGEWARAFPARPAGQLWSERLTPTLPDVSSSRALPEGSRPQGTVRERIILGTALAIRAKGYQDITVNDIVAAAGVSRRGFYNEFPSKAAAFVAAYELVFQRVLGATAPAFFTQRVWSERVWDAALAFTGMIAREPLLTYLGLVECYAIGPDFTLRVHDTQLAFTLFLEDGYRQSGEAESLPRSFSALVAATIFEVAFHASRRGPRFDARRVQPLAVYIALAPFVGPDAAGEFVLEKVRETVAASAGAA
jgi:AcrR family transcriptional regulator